MKERITQIGGGSFILLMSLLVFAGVQVLGEKDKLYAKTTKKFSPTSETPLEASEKFLGLIRQSFEKGEFENAILLYKFSPMFGEETRRAAWPFYSHSLESKIEKDLTLAVEQLLLENYQDSLQTLESLRNFLILQRYNPPDVFYYLLDEATEGLAKQKEMGI